MPSAQTLSPGKRPSPVPDVSRLEAQGLQKAYGSRKVVKDVSLAVFKGEVVGLLGPNGAGKTTSFYMLVGLLRSDAGQILLDGQAIQDLPIHRRARLGLGYLPQEASIFRKLNVADNVRAVLELQEDDAGQPLGKAAIEARLDELLKDLHVDHLRDSPAPALSGGERRRVEIARALATNPRFILLDEPFAGIDPIAVIEIQRIIGFLKSRGIGVLITDHNVRETLGICDRAYIINDGHVLTSGTPAEIVENADVRRGNKACHSAFRSTWRSRPSCSNPSACCNSPRWRWRRRSSKCSTRTRFWSAPKTPPTVKPSGWTRPMCP